MVDVLKVILEPETLILVFPLIIIERDTAFSSWIDLLSLPGLLLPELRVMLILL